MSAPSRSSPRTITPVAAGYGDVLHSRLRGGPAHTARGAAGLGLAFAGLAFMVGVLASVVPHAPAWLGPLAGGLTAVIADARSGCGSRPRKVWAA